MTDAGVPIGFRTALAPDDEQASRVTPPSLLQIAQGRREPIRVGRSSTAWKAAVSRDTE
jgi:hypothetical protein